MPAKNALRMSARGMPCHLRLPGICCHNPETTVLAHLRVPGLAGTSFKPADVCAVFACRTCHDVIDGRAPVDAALREVLPRYILDGHLRTLDYWWSNGLLNVGSGR